MTTQAEPQHPPAQTYPTAPPWAPPPAPEATGYQPPMPAAYGQLLVPYPEEMQNASRPAPPSWWPIIPLTFFFGVFGLIPTIRRANRARRGRNSQTPYWVAFALTFVVAVLCWNVAGAFGKPAVLNYRESLITKDVQQNIVKDGQLKAKNRLTATSATCEPLASRAADGQRLYSCLLRLDDGRTGTIDVRADEDGNWTAVPLPK